MIIKSIAETAGCEPDLQVRQRLATNFSAYRLPSCSLLAWLCVCFLMLLASCQQTKLAAYDQRAYENATRLKAESLAWFADIGSECQIEDTALANWRLQMESAFEYANGIAHNNAAARAWRELIDQIAASLLQACEAASSTNTKQLSVSSAFHAEVLEQLAEGFDTLICLEANKRLVQRCANALAVAERGAGDE